MTTIEEEQSDCSRACDTVPYCQNLESLDKFDGSIKRSGTHEKGNKKILVNSGCKTNPSLLIRYSGASSSKSNNDK